MLVDSHCHLGDAAFDADREAVVARAAAAGVERVVIVAGSLDDTTRGVALADTYGLAATAGVHPHEASSWNDDTAARLRSALDAPGVVAVGETGLDYHYDHSPRPVQRDVFATQMRLAADARLPVVVHAREADDDVAALITEFADAVPAIILHSFSSGETLFAAGLAARAYFGFSGMVTFKHWPHRERVAACPADRLLVETDSPYLAPVPHRGSRNEPAFVRDVAEAVARLRATSLDALATLTTANAARCFGARVAQPLSS